MQTSINSDVQDIESTMGGAKICGQGPCGFSDSKTSSKDAEERSASMRKLVIAITLSVIFMSVEVIGGIKANSLAIMSDAAHLLTDVAAFAISLFSLWVAGWEATPRHSYGFFRVEILGTLVSILMTWLLTGILVYDAIARLIGETGEVKGFLMFVVSAFGLVVNISMAVLLGHDHGHGHCHGHDHVHSHDHGHSELGHGHGDHHHDTEDHHNHHSEGADHTQPMLKKERNINVQGAYLHVLGDLLQSIGVMIGGAIIWYNPEWKIVDLLCTLVFSMIVLWTTVKMLSNILEVLMECTPREIDATKVENGLCEMDEVITVHELHIWVITIGKVVLACHVIAKSDADTDMVLEKIIDYIKREYNITHVTIQVEHE